MEGPETRSYSPFAGQARERGFSYNEFSRFRMDMDLAEAGTGSREPLIPCELNLLVL